MILCWLFLVFDAYIGYMSCFWLPNTFTHLPNLRKCSTVNSHLFKIKKVDISITQPSLQLEHKQVSWHQLSVTPSGNIRREERNNLDMGYPSYWREWFQRLLLLAEALMARQGLYQWTQHWQQEQLKPNWVAGSLANSSI